MKSPKSYLYKIAILLITIGSMAFLYWYGYHKVFDQKYIPKNADGIIMVDIKNTRNHFIISYLKNPSEWQWNRPKTKFEKLFNPSNLGIKATDYFAFFHIENQPIEQWFATAVIENESVFEKAANKAHFNKTKHSSGMSTYYSKAVALLIIKYSTQILVANIPEKQKQVAIKTAEELFVKKQFLDTKRIEKTIDTDNEVTFWIKKNSFLEKDGILNLKLKDQEITIDGQLQLEPKFKKEWQFSQNPNALLSLGFNFEMIRELNILKKHSSKINKLIGFDLDSILVHNPTKTELVLNRIIEKKDSAISYSYDDDFNPIKKVVVKNNREPSFYFSMQTSDSKKIYNYLKTQNVIDNHNVFVNFPLAKTKTTVLKNNFTLEANPVKNQNLKSSIPKIVNLQVHFNKLQKEDWRYVIAKNKGFSFFKSFETLTIDLDKQNNVVEFNARLTAKKNISTLY